MTDCPPGSARYQARQNAYLAGDLHEVWTVKCYPPTQEIAVAVMAGILTGEAEDGSFPDPVTIKQRCCGG